MVIVNAINQFRIVDRLIIADKLRDDINRPGTPEKPLLHGMMQACFLISDYIHSVGCAKIESLGYAH